MKLILFFNLFTFDGQRKTTHELIAHESLIAYLIELTHPIAEAVLKTDCPNRFRGSNYIIKTTRRTRGMHWPFKGIILAEPKGSLKNPPTANITQAAAQAAVFYASGFLLPVNGSMYSLNVN